MEATFLQRHPFLKDVLNIGIFIICVLIGTLLINTFVFRSFSVVGPSMEKTLYTNDRLIVSRLPVTLSQLQNKTYIPNRGQVIVFKNPHYSTGLGDEYIVKRVIAFSGERVVLQDGTYILTDKEGRWHADNIRPGTHVVQLDLDSLPKGYEVIQCQDNSRFAGRSYSRHVAYVGIRATY